MKYDLIDQDSYSVVKRGMALNEIKGRLATQAVDDLPDDEYYDKDKDLIERMSAYALASMLHYEIREGAEC